VGFSKAGYKLLRDSLEITEEIWREYEEILGTRRLKTLRSSMETLSSELDARRTQMGSIED
jgi:hypothetical protein